MDNVLFVFNMQEMYVGKNRNKDKFSFDADGLTQRVNQRIMEYQPEEVFYIVSIGKGLFKGSMPAKDSRNSDFARDLKVRSKNIYEKTSLIALQMTLLPILCALVVLRK